MLGLRFFAPPKVFAEGLDLFSKLYITDPIKQKALREKLREATKLRERRDVLVHSVWILSENVGKPVIRVKETKSGERVFRG